MSKKTTDPNVIPNLLNKLAQAIETYIDPEEACGALDGMSFTKARTLASTARNIAQNFKAEAVSDPSSLELDFANLMEGGSFSMDLSFDRSKFYLEFADDWTGHIKKIFAAETFAGVIKAASDKKDEADLIYQMSKEQPVSEEEVAEEFEEKIPEDDELVEYSEEIPQEEIQEDDTVVSSDEELVRKIVQEDAKVGNLGMSPEHFNPPSQDAPEPSDLFPEKEATRNNFFGPSKKDELPGQKTFPVDPKAFTRN
ncbi:hypothetical protein LCGC14_1894240 [marine sediment metagenome]|uniref:Uncharacterized protein n=1 Tax=marine sediment metagenome TaxID=412755 RepID=A0A0F9GLU7_9ZZZZ